jgi:hypothetical protein
VPFGKLLPSPELPHANAIMLAMVTAPTNAQFLRIR